MDKIQLLFKTGLGCLIVLLLHFKTAAQSGIDIRINEILVVNDSNYIDDFGQRNSWIELFNTAYNKVNIGGMFLTNDHNNPTKYPIAKGDPITVIPARNYLVFFADNHPTRGILHLNFDLRGSKYLALYDVNGSTLVDEIAIPVIGKDTSYGRQTDGELPWVILEKTTPKSNNFTGNPPNPGEEFLTFDPFGFGMAMIAMSVVFISLMLLYLLFKNTKRIYALDLKQVFANHKPIVSEEKNLDLTGEINAAIALSLVLYSNELHDNEATVLTIKKVARTYSPWSSKIYGLRQYHK